MPSRVELHTKLENLLGSKNVYYQPPANKTMQYDAIRYSLSRKDTKHADDRRYTSMNCYDVIVISRLPDPEVVDKILDLPYASFNRHYVSDNLNHYSITLYH